MNEHLLAGVFITLFYFSSGLLMMTKAAEPSRIFGYRTQAARRNMDTWLEANHYAGKSIMIVGSVLMVLLLLYMKVLPEPRGFYPAIFFSIVLGSIVVFILTEAHLNRIFFKDGKRRPYR
jgi:uncharacterized membrane protein